MRDESSRQKYFFIPSKSLKKTTNSTKINHLRPAEAISFWGRRPVRVELRAGCREHIANTFLLAAFICSFLLPSFCCAVYSTRVKSEGDAPGFH